MSCKIENMRLSNGDRCMEMQITMYYSNINANEHINGRCYINEQVIFLKNENSLPTLLEMFWVTKIC